MCRGELKAAEKLPSTMNRMEGPNAAALYLHFLAAPRTEKPKISELAVVL